MFKNRKFFASKPFLMPLFAFAFVLALASCGGAGDSGSPAPSDGGNGDWRTPGAIGNTSNVGIPISGAATKIVGTIEKRGQWQVHFGQLNETMLQGHSKAKSCNKIKAEIPRGDSFDDTVTIAVFSDEHDCSKETFQSNHGFEMIKGTIKFPFGNKGFRSYPIYRAQAGNLPTQTVLLKHAVLYHFKKSDIGQSFTVNTLQFKSKMLSTLGFTGPGTRKFTVNTFKVESEWQQLPITEDQFPIAFFVTPADQKLAFYRPLSSAVKGIEIGTSDIGTESLYQVALDRSVTPIGVDDYEGAPGGEFLANNFSEAGSYGQNRFFHLIKLSDDSLGIVWQDRIKYSIYLTKFKPTGETSTIELPNSSTKATLGAVAHDASGSIYYFTVGARYCNIHCRLYLIETRKALPLMVYKVSETGKVILKKNLNKGDLLRINVANQLFDAKEIDDSPVELNMRFTNSMKVSGKKVALFFTRDEILPANRNNRHEHYHQFSSMLVLDDKFNILTKKHTEHSFTNLLSVASDGSFIGADLGGDQPRGISFHKTYGNEITSKVVYTFKAKHQLDPWNVWNSRFAPPLKDIHGKLVQLDFARPHRILQLHASSNDTKVYTELGSIVETDKGYLMFFLGEGSAGSSLDNSKVMYSMLSRGIYYVLINKDIKSATKSHDTIVSSDLSIAKGLMPNVTGDEIGFWYPNAEGTKVWQQNTGVGEVLPLGDHTTASRLSAVKRSDGKILLTWDNYGFSSGRSILHGRYEGTTSVVFDSKTGKTIGDPIVRSGSQFNRTNQPLRIGKTTYFVTGNEYKHTLQISTIKEK